MDAMQKFVPFFTLRSAKLFFKSIGAKDTTFAIWRHKYYYVVSKVFPVLAVICIRCLFTRYLRFFSPRECSMEKRIDKTEYACSFAARLLENGSDSELLMLNRVTSKQLEMLSENVSFQYNYRTSLNFITDMEEFSKATKVRIPKAIT